MNNILFKMKMMDKKDALIPSLSGWEKQRVAIARALISNPEFIIADEPTWNLDWESSKEIIDVLLELNRAWNTIVCITHNLQLINYAKEINKNLKVFTLKK
jgi:ABC-type ATPase involved in cell division